MSRNTILITHARFEQRSCVCIDCNKKYTRHYKETGYGNCSQCGGKLIRNTRTADIKLQKAKEEYEKINSTAHA